MGCKVRGFEFQQWQEIYVFFKTSMGPPSLVLNRHWGYFRGVRRLGLEICHSVSSFCQSSELGELCLRGWRGGEALPLHCRYFGFTPGSGDWLFRMQVFLVFFSSSRPGLRRKFKIVPLLFVTTLLTFPPLITLYNLRQTQPDSSGGSLSCRTLQVFFLFLR